MRKTTPMFAAMKEAGVSYKELAERTGRDVRTLVNLAANNNKSTALRQAVTNLLQKKLWPSIEITERLVSFPPGTEVQYSSAKEAREAAADELAAGIVERRGRLIIFRKRATFLIDADKPRNLRRISESIHE